MPAEPAALASPAAVRRRGGRRAARRAGGRHPRPACCARLRRTGLRSAARRGWCSQAVGGSGAVVDRSRSRSRVGSWSWVAFRFVPRARRSRFGTDRAPAPLRPRSRPSAQRSPAVHGAREHPDVGRRGGIHRVRCCDGASGWHVDHATSAIIVSRAAPTSSWTSRRVGVPPSPQSRSDRTPGRGPSRTPRVVPTGSATPPLHEGERIVTPRLTGPLLQQPSWGRLLGKGMSDKEARTACLRRLVRDAVDGGWPSSCWSGTSPWRRDRRIIRSELHASSATSGTDTRTRTAEPVLWIADALAWAHHAGGDCPTVRADHPAERSPDRVSLP